MSQALQWLVWYGQRFHDESVEIWMTTTSLQLHTSHISVSRRVLVDTSERYRVLSRGAKRRSAERWVLGGVP